MVPPPPLPPLITVRPPQLLKRPFAHFSRQDLRVKKQWQHQATTLTWVPKFQRRGGKGNSHISSFWLSVRAFQFSVPQNIPAQRVVSLRVQNFTLPLVEFCKVSVSPFLQPIEVPPDGSTTIWHISHSSWFGVIQKFAEGTFCPIIQITKVAVTSGVHC